MVHEEGASFFISVAKKGGGGGGRVSRAKGSVCTFMKYAGGKKVQDGEAEFTGRGFFLRGRGKKLPWVNSYSFNTTKGKTICSSKAMKN